MGLNGRRRRPEVEKKRKQLESLNWAQNNIFDWLVSFTGSGNDIHTVFVALPSVVCSSAWIEVITEGEWRSLLRLRMEEDTNISNTEVTETAIAPNIVDEPLNALVASTSMPAQCLKNIIVQSGWSQLPPELLQEIAFLLTDISDLTRFRAVCTAWQYAVYTAPAPKPTCLPCLLLPSYQRGGNLFGAPSNLSLLSTGSFSDSYADARQLGDVGHRICGTGHGWLLAVSDLNMTTWEFSIFLLNPLTGLRIYLPSSASLVAPTRSLNAYVNFQATIALLKGSKSPASGCIVMITWYKHLGFSFCRYTGECHAGTWNTVETFSPIDYNCSFVYHQGKIVAHLATGRVLLVDTASLSMIVVNNVPTPSSTDGVSRCATSRIVEASGEVFLAVYSWRESEAYVFRLDLTVQPPRWCRTADIGDHALFIDFSQLQCVTMQEHVKLDLRRNCICTFKGEWINDSFTHSILDCQLDKGTVKELPLRFKSSNHELKWFIPSLI